MKKATTPPPSKADAPISGAISLPPRLGFVLAFALILLALLIAWSGDFIVDLLIRIFLDGGLALLWLTCAGLLGWMLLAPLKIELRGPLGIATCAALGMGILALSALGLGLLGLLSRTSVILLALVGPFAWSLRLARKRNFSIAPVRQWLSRPVGWNWLYLATLPSLSIALAGATIMPGYLWNPLDPHPYDVLIYHLELPREWYQLGHIAPLAHNVYSYFPANMEMQYLMGMDLKGGPWDGMYFAQYLSLLCTILFVLATAHIASGLSGHKPAAGPVAALLATAVPWIPMLGAVAYVESALLLYFILAVGWSLLAMRNTPHMARNMVLAGALAGLACGVKYTAVPTALLAIPAALVIASLLYSPWRRQLLFSRFTSCILFGLVGTLLFAPWMVRNFAWIHNPVYPLEMKQLGRGAFDAVQVERWDRAHRARPDQDSVHARLHAFWSEVASSWQYAYLLIPLGLAAGLLAIRNPGTGALFLLLIFQILFWLFLTHLMGRFAILIVPLLAILAAARLPPRIGAIAGAVALILGLLGLPGRPGVALVFADKSSVGRAGFFGLMDVTQLQPKGLEGIEQGHTRVAMIGGGNAFFYRMPIQNLRYRTIFDIKFPPGKSEIDAWLGQDLDQLRREGVVVIYPGELARLARTYYQVPPPPPQWLTQEDSVVLPQLPPTPPAPPGPQSSPGSR